ncbi:MAG TPA: SAM-dependent methyltransferase [Leptospiraceae bacterium]|nr:SAM-dependent methyltransferase [Leptospiraceae bacterium]
MSRQKAWILRQQYRTLLVYRMISSKQVKLMRILLCIPGPGARQISTSKPWSATQKLLAPILLRDLKCCEFDMPVNAHQEIISYYDTCEWDYQIVWNTQQSFALHYGFWTEGVRSLRQAQQYQNQWMCEAAGISKEDHVLDAGCGIGGSSVYLALSTGCRATGISLSQRQIDRAREIAEENGASNADFQVRDFCASGFADSTFNVVWAIESVCHAGDKSAFLREAFRLLKPGGRLIIADGFSLPAEDLDSYERKLMRGWLEPWAVDSLATFEEFEQSMSSVGFEQISARDVTDLILPSARILNSRARLATWPANLMYWMGLRNSIQHGNYLAGKFQWKALKRNLWRYGVFTARKPGTGHHS